MAVPVDMPAAQSPHAAVETVLYLAMGHALHVVPPVLVSVLVMDPARQAVQLDAEHGTVGVPAQIAVGVEGVPPNDGVRRYLPAAQAAHDVAPVFEPILVIDPDAQVVQAADVVVPVAEWKPALHVHEVAPEAEKLLG